MALSNSNKDPFTNFTQELDLHLDEHGNSNPEQTLIANRIENSYANNPGNITNQSQEVVNPDGHKEKTYFVSN